MNYECFPGQGVASTTALVVFPTFVSNQVALNLTTILQGEKCSLAFYRTQVNLGSDLWVRMSVRLSVRHKLQDVCKT